jgi:predicted DNA-binding transcriptional regulator AlpA
VRRSRFSVEQIVAVLKQAELGMAEADVIRKIGISEQTFYRWKSSTRACSPIRLASSSNFRKRTPG